MHLLSPLDALTSTLTVTPCADGWQASLELSRGSFRVRVAARASEAVAEVLGLGVVPPPMPPY